MSSDEESVHSVNDISDVEDIVEKNDVPEDGEDFVENENTEEVQREETEDGQNKDEDAERKTVKPKRVVRNPQPKLNEETLKGPRGIAALQSYFDRVKFKGKGYEHQDLNVIMKTYEYWCHRLFPKFPFDTCIERLEKLGTKRAVQTQIKRIRFDLLIEEKPVIDSSDEETNVEGFVDIQNEEINKQNEFDQLLVSTAPTSPPPLELTEEQKEKIRLNKERAEKLRQERLQKIRNKAKVNLDISSQLPSTSGVNSGIVDDFSDTQGDNLSQGNRLNGSTEPEFDLESNLKGKTSLMGSTVKKKSKNIEGMGDEESITAGKKNGNLIVSDESDSDLDAELSFRKYQAKNHNGNNAKNSNISKRLKNRINSDGSEDEQIAEETVQDRNTSNRLKSLVDSDKSEDESNAENTVQNGKTSKSVNNVIGSDESEDERTTEVRKSADLNGDSNDSTVAMKTTKKRVASILDSDDESMDVVENTNAVENSEKLALSKDLVNNKSSEESMEIADIENGNLKTSETILVNGNSDTNII